MFSKSNESSFFKKLCECLKENKKLDICDIMTEVSNHVPTSEGISFFVSILRDRFVLKWRITNNRIIKKEVKKTIIAYEQSIVTRSKHDPKILYSYINQNKKCKEKSRAYWKKITFWRIIKKKSVQY